MEELRQELVNLTNTLYNLYLRQEETRSESSAAAYKKAMKFVLKLKDRVDRGEFNETNTKG